MFRNQVLIFFKLSFQHKESCLKLIQFVNFQQTKRKIEDVSRKLEALYDCLRENKVRFKL